jgi:uncharacterized coiled-coil protein SlyX
MQFDSGTASGFNVGAVATPDTQQTIQQAMRAAASCAVAGMRVHINQVEHRLRTTERRLDGLNAQLEHTRDTLDKCAQSMQHLSRALDDTVALATRVQKAAARPPKHDRDMADWH